MNLDFNILVFLTAFIFALPIIGYLFRFNIPISIFFLLAGTFMIAILLSADGIILDSFSLEGVVTTIYHVGSNTFGVTINSVQRSIVAEYPSSSSSQLIGDTFDCIMVPLSKTGSPPISTPIIAGVFDSSGNIVRQFGQNLNASALIASPTFFIFEFCLPEGENYTVGSIPAFSERIGIKYDGGNSSNSVVTRSDGNNPFDGTTTFKQTFLSGTWSSQTAEDLTMTLTLDGSSIIEDKVMDFTFTGENYQLKVIMIFISVMFIVGGALVEVRQR